MSGKGYKKIIQELDFPPVFLIPDWQFEMLEGEEKREDNKVDAKTVGQAAIDFPVFTKFKGLSGRELDNVIYHEIAHHLWPWRQHWWIECFAEKMASGGGRGLYAQKYNKTIADLPPRKALLKMARRQSARLKKAYRIARTKKGSPIPHPNYEEKPT